MSGPVTILHPLQGCTDPHGLTQTLLEIQPTYVIMYDPDMQFVRQLEVSFISLILHWGYDYYLFLNVF